MKHHRWLVILAATLVLFIMSGLAYAEDKLAFVDLSRVFDEYNKTKKYDKILEKQQQDYEKQREIKVSEVKKFQEKLSLLSEEEREARRSELEGKIAELQEFDRSVTQDLRKQRDEKVQEIFKDINDAIDDYAKKEGITFVFDKRALAYADKNLDITKQITGIINDKYK